MAQRTPPKHDSSAEGADPSSSPPNPRPAEAERAAPEASPQAHPAETSLSSPPGQGRPRRVIDMRSPRRPPPEKERASRGPAGPTEQRAPVHRSTRSPDDGGTHRARELKGEAPTIDIIEEAPEQPAAKPKPAASAASPARHARPAVDPRRRGQDRPAARPHAEPRAAVPKAPPAEAKAPRAAEAKKPHAAETKAPHTAEAKKPHAAETKAPHTAEAKKPRTAETKAPHAAETKKPHAVETKAPEAPGHAPSWAPRPGASFPRKKKPALTAKEALKAKVQARSKKPPAKPVSSQAAGHSADQPAKDRSEKRDAPPERSEHAAGTERSRRSGGAGGAERAARPARADGKGGAAPRAARGGSPPAPRDDAEQAVAEPAKKPGILRRLLNLFKPAGKKDQTP